MMDVLVTDISMVEVGGVGAAKRSGLMHNNHKNIMLYLVLQ